MRDFKEIRVAVAGTGYVGLSIATLLSQHHHVTAVEMCIRDRHNVRLEFEKKYPNIDFVPVIGDVRVKERVRMAVSYTHLDVYKRQIFNAYFLQSIRFQV